MTNIRLGIQPTYNRGKSVHGSGIYLSSRSCMFGVQCLCFVIYSLIGLTNNSHPCLTWQMDDNALHLICRFNESSKSLSFFDNLNNERVVCSLNGSASNCTTSLEGLTSYVNISRHTVVLTISTTTTYVINGTWTCMQGVSMYTTEVSKSKGAIDSTDMQIKGQLVKISGIYSAVQLVCFSCIEPDRYIAEFLVNNRSADSVIFNIASHKCYHYNEECRENITCSCSLNSYTRIFNLTHDRTPTYYSCEMTFKDSGSQSKFSKHATLFFNGSDIIDMGTRTKVLVGPEVDNNSAQTKKNYTGSVSTKKSDIKATVGTWIGTCIAVLIIVLIIGTVIYFGVRSANKSEISIEEKIPLLTKNEPVDKYTSTEDLKEPAVLSELEYTQTDEDKITKQQINYLRVVHLVTGPAVSTVRHVFDTEFDPGKLTYTIRKNANKLINLRQKKRISNSQFDLLTKDDRLTSKKLDLQLMICLLRNIGPKFDITDELPAPTRVTVEANLSRIKYYRNTVLHNHTHGTLSDKLFTTVWDGLCEAITGLNKKAFVKYSSANEDNADATDAVTKALTETMQNETSHLKWRVRTMTNEENYYLRIIHLWHSVVFQAVRVKFDSIFPSSHPFKTLNLSSKDFRNILQYNKRDKRCALIGLDALCQEKNEKDKQSSRKFTLTLMIELLLSPGIYHKIDEKEYTALSKLLLLYRKMYPSDNTIFTRETFDAHWKTITTSVIDLVGETQQRIYERKFCFLDPEGNQPLKFNSQTSNIPCAVICEI